MNVRILSKIFLGLLWLATFISALVWVFVDHPTFDPEPVTVILGLISGAITGLVQEYIKAIDEEEYSVPYALAYGYVNNFLEPVITQVLTRNGVPVVYVFMPENLSELEPKNIDRLMSVIRKKFSSTIIQLEMKEGRSRDIITILKNDPLPENVMFDFPNTLLTLNSLIDYKVESKKGSFPAKAKEELAKRYITKFRDTVSTLLQAKGILQYVSYSDKNLAV